MCFVFNIQAHGETEFYNSHFRDGLAGLWGRNITRKTQHESGGIRGKTCRIHASRLSEDKHDLLFIAVRKRSFLIFRVVSF